jgi:DNA-binding CsgD family transcriptional regulator
MPAIAPHLPRALFDAIFEMNAARNHADFVSAVTAGLSRLIRTDVCMLQLFDRKARRIRLKMIPEQPFLPSEIDYYTTHTHEMPLVPYYETSGDTRARRLSDVTDIGLWRKSEYYRRCRQRQDLRHAIALPIAVDASVVAAISLSRRHPDFTARDCALLDAFASHFRLAWSRQQNPWRISRRQTQPRDAGTLTARETDILYWITEGKQNREIATILGLSLYTVQKHVANLLRKTGAENRHALTVSQLLRPTGT